jgi:hypothetical protein
MHACIPNERKRTRSSDMKRVTCPIMGFMGHSMSGHGNEGCSGVNSKAVRRNGVLFQVKRCGTANVNVPLTLSVKNVTFDTSLPSSEHIFS